MIRDEFDTLKVFATILMVIGHITILYTPQSAFEDIQVNSTMSFFTNGIYLFHMPLFIALSGAIFMAGSNNGKYKFFWPFIINKAKRIIIPYLFIGVCCLLPTLMILYDVGITTCLSGIYIGGGYVKALMVSWSYLLVFFVLLDNRAFSSKPSNNVSIIPDNRNIIFQIRMQ